VFRNAEVEAVSDFMASFEFEGQRFNALNSGPKNEAVSFFISVETQNEGDYFWNRLTADGGEAGTCGWLKDNSACPGRWCQQRSAAISAPPTARRPSAPCRP
jgi:predicted 3-demethylubiquinone-9 3-methyltransferase (glyoxalase superfamily)